MAHIHSVYDTDGHFIINADTRLLENASEARVNLVQYDHNSERVTFELERYVDGHDMSECNRVEVIFTNKGRGGTSRGRYIVSDLEVAPDDPDTVIFSWLISQAATLYSGTLSFGVRFVCTSDDGVMDYAWNTAVYAGLTVSEGSGVPDASETCVYDSLQVAIGKHAVRHDAAQDLTDEQKKQALGNLGLTDTLFLDAEAVAQAAASASASAEAAAKYAEDTRVIEPQDLSKTYNLALSAEYRTEKQVTKGAKNSQYVWEADANAFSLRIPAIEGDVVTFTVFDNTGHGYVFGCHTEDGTVRYSATKAMLDSGTKAWMTYADGVATVDVSSMIDALGVSDMVFCVQYANEPNFRLTSKRLPLHIDWIGLSEVDEKRLAAVEAAAGLDSSITFNPVIPGGYYEPTETVYTLGRTSTAAELYAVLDPLVDGAYCTKSLLFTESGGLPGYVYRFIPQVPGNRTSGNNTTYPTILIVADHHGQEKGSAISLAYFLKDMVENWASSPILEYLRFSVNFVVVPTANPYGFQSQHHRNRNGVDLNRNYDADWVETDAAEQTYGGPSAASEIETQAIQELIQRTSDALLYIDYHTFGALNVTDYWSINWHMLCAAPWRSAAPEELAAYQLQRATAHYKQTYFPGGIGDAAFTGYVSHAQYGGNSKIYARQQGIPNALVFEGCGGLPDESEAYSQRAIRLNVEQLGNYIFNAAAWFARNPNRIRQTL